MKKIKFAEAILEATDHCMEQDSRVVLIGLGVPDPKGIFGTTLGLQDKYGKERVMDMPLAENLIAGVTVGLATQGIIPIAEFQFMGFIYPAVDQIINHAFKFRPDISQSQQIFHTFFLYHFFTYSHHCVIDFVLTSTLRNEMFWIDTCRIFTSLMYHQSVTNFPSM